MTEPTRPPTDGAATFRALAARHERCFWLDVIHPRGWPGHGSTLGWLADDDVSLSLDAATGQVLRHASGRSQLVGDDVFAALEQEVAAGPADALWVGYLGYAARADLPGRPGTSQPDAVWLRADPRRLVTVPAQAPSAVPPPPQGTEPLTDEQWYAGAFATVQEHLHAGRSYEVNLTYRVSAPGPTTPADVYLALRRRSPAPYAGYLQHDIAGARGWLLSASPERFLAVDGEGAVETRPIKGTLPRGATEPADRAGAAWLAGDPKSRAENLMIVDLLRNDLSRVCRPGTVQVPSLMQVESYAQVHQLVSVVTGRLGEGVTTIEALRSTFPPGSMTGAPKLRTMEIIDQVEQGPRGVYSGTFGWVRPDGSADLAVIIRSLTTGGGGRWELGTGGGITVRSDPADELAESYAKARALLGALTPD